MSMMGHGLGGHSASRGQVDEEVFGAVYDQRVILRLIPFIVPYKKMVSISVVAMLIYTFTQVAVPWIIAHAIDDYILKDDASGLTLIFAIFIGIAFVN